MFILGDWLWAASKIPVIVFVAKLAFDVVLVKILFGFKNRIINYALLFDVMTVSEFCISNSPNLDNIPDVISKFILGHPLRLHLSEGEAILSYMLLWVVGLIFDVWITKKFFEDQNKNVKLVCNISIKIISVLIGIIILMLVPSTERFVPYFINELAGAVAWVCVSIFYVERYLNLFALTIFLPIEAIRRGIKK